MIPETPPPHSDPALEDRDLEHRRWRHWFFLLGVGSITLTGLALVAVVLMKERTQVPWPWPGSEFVLLTGLLAVVFFFGGYLTHQEREVAELRARLARSRHEALRESEERFRQLSDNIDDVFWIKNADTGALHYLSPAFERIWGRDRQSFYEGRVRWMDTLHAEDRRRVVKLFAGRAARRGYDEEYRIIRPDGEERWVHDRGFPVRDERGVIFRMAGIVQDVTEEKALRTTLHQSQKMEALGLLAGGVAHDFNNLLTVILGRTDLIARRNGNPDLARDVELIGRTARQAASLTRRLLAMSRRQVLAPEIIDVNGIVREMEDVIRRLVGETIDVVIEPGQGLFTVKADRGQIEQILLNLSINSRDAMLRGGTLRITTANETLGTNGTERAGILLTVSDTGCGMEPAVAARVFEPFFTTKDTGTGLGLATVQGIVKQSGGEIRLETAPREGAAFRIFLPRVEAAISPSGNSIPALTTTGTETVLVVEDQSDVRALAREVLEEAGYRVLHTGDAEEAVRLAGSEPLDLILCDVFLRGANGFELAATLMDAGRCSRILYMSGHAGRAGLSRAIAEEQLPILEKPFRPQDLLRRVREALEYPSERAAA